MAWWNFRRRPSETVTARWIGETFAQEVNPTRVMQEVHEWHEQRGEEHRVFVGLAAQNLLAWRIVAAQKSIRDVVGAETLDAIHALFAGAMVEASPVVTSREAKAVDVVREVLDLAARLQLTFYANARSKPPLPLPHWFVGKELCVYVERSSDRLNPEVVMLYAQRLSDCMVSIKMFIDRLIEQEVRICV